jgi:hypothetical protein
MTTQATDSLEYAGNNWIIKGRVGDGMFRLRDHGIEGNVRATSCYRGYVAAYRLSDEDKILRLGEVIITHDFEWEGGDTPPLFGAVLQKHHDGGWPIYPNLSQPVRFSGALLVGTDHRREWRDLDAGYPALGSATVHELLFHGGVLQAVIDRSAEFRALRRLAQSQTDSIDLPEDASEADWILRVDGHIRQLRAFVGGKLLLDYYGTDLGEI